MKIRHLVLKITSLILILPTFLFAKSSVSKSHSSNSISERIAAVQKAVTQLPPKEQQRLKLTAQWPNWGNWLNWNNWAKWSKWNNWNNWGNWANY